MSNTRPRLSRSFGKILVETPYDADFVEAIKVAIPKSHRVYDRGLWTIDVQYYSCAVILMQHFWGSKYIDAVGGVAEPQTQAWREPWNVWRNSKDRQFRREQKTHKADSSTWSILGGGAPTSAFLTLYVTGNAPKEVIKAAYRALAQMHHPDSGGDTETMARINAAYQELQKAGKA